MPFTFTKCPVRRHSFIVLTSLYSRIFFFKTMFMPYFNQWSTIFWLGLSVAYQLLKKFPETKTKSCSKKARGGHGVGTCWCAFSYEKENSQNLLQENVCVTCRGPAVIHCYFPRNTSYCTACRKTCRHSICVCKLNYSHGCKVLGI